MATSTKDFSAKDRVHHSVYGLGTISSIDERYTRIDFDENGSRKFLNSLMKLEHSDVPAPDKARPRARKAKTKKA